MNDTTSMTAAAPFRAVLTPHRSLSPTGFLILMVAIGVVNVLADHLERHGSIEAYEAGDIQDALAETAYQNAVQYARERTAGRALTGAEFPDQPADPIIVHPDVRRVAERIATTWLSRMPTMLRTPAGWSASATASAMRCARGALSISRGSTERARATQ